MQHEQPIPSGDGSPSQDPDRAFSARDSLRDPTVGQLPSTSSTRDPVSGRVPVRGATEASREAVPQSSLGGPPPPRFRIPVVRPEDLLVLDFEFFNLERRTEGGIGELFRVDQDQPALLVAYFPPQNIAENAMYEYAEGMGKKSRTPPDNPPPSPFPQPPPPLPDDDLAAPPVLARLSGGSRLVFLMPDELLPLTYSLEALLDACSKCDLVVAANAAPPWSELEPAALLRSPARRPEAVVASLEAAVGMRVAGAVSELRADLQALVTRQVTRLIRHDVGALIETLWPEGRVDLRLTELTEAQSDLERRSTAALSRALADLGDLLTPADQERLRAVLAEALSEVVQATVSGYRIAGVPGRAPARALAAGAALVIRSPNEFETAIELPYRLILSPNSFARWAHSLVAVAHTGRTELWHTRLEDRGGDEERKTVRAIWSPDYNPDQRPKHDWPPFYRSPVIGAPPPLRTSLTRLDHHLLVEATAENQVVEGAKKPVTANRLMLSALGGWLDARGEWPKAELEAWEHRAALGRDHYVRVVYKGFLFPFGHAASLVKVTERKFTTYGSGASQQRIAYLKQRFFIVVRQPEKKYGAYEGMASAGVPSLQHGGRQFPFQRVRITTRVTPNLNPPPDSAVTQVTDPDYSKQDAFWPQVKGADDQSQDFRFHLVAEDRDGRSVDFTLPLMFLSIANPQNSPEGGLAYNTDAVGAAMQAYTEADEPRRTAKLGSQSLAYAESPESPEEGDTRLETDEIEFGGQEPASTFVDWKDKALPRFYPCIVRASVRVPALKQLLGNEGLLQVAYPTRYLENEKGFGPPQAGRPDLDNRGEVFLQRAGGELKVSFGAADQPSDKAGGLVTPDFSVQGLSRRIGPFGGDTIANIATGSFKPKDFFGPLGDAKILGGVSLQDVLGDLDVFSGAAALAAGEERVPRITTRRVGDALETELCWKTKALHSAGIFKRLEEPDTELAITATVTAGPSEPEVTIDATLKNFKLDLFEFIILHFDKLRFIGGSAGKPDVDVDLNLKDGVSFGGPLEFVNTLKDLIPSTGFSDPPDLDVSEKGLSASYSLGLPDIPLGAFSLQNVNLGAGFTLPFTGDPILVRFHFAERHDPFSLTISLFGGGGFFALAVDGDGLHELEAALEFGASISVNLGVASGGVYVKAGIYFHWLVEKVEQDDGTVTVTETAELLGYFEMGGELSVLGIISISLKFYLELGYSNGQASGQATLLVEIDVLMFSDTVEITVERKFKGGQSDPTFVDFVPDETIWQGYCAAFATEGGAA